MNVDKRVLKRHKRNRAERAVIDRTLDRLYEQLEDVDECSCTVKKQATENKR